MQKKQNQLFLAFGVAANVLLLLFFVYVYYVSIPRAGDLKVLQRVIVPRVDNPLLEQELNNLHKSQKLPIELDVLDLGKENPYQ